MIDSRPFKVRRVMPLLALVAAVTTGFAVIIGIRAAYDGIRVPVSSLFLWQFVVWAPWLLFGVLVAELARRFSFAAMHARSWLAVHVVFAGLLTGAHYLWFRATSNSLSPFLGMPETRYGVFAYFFVFWSTLDLLLYALVLAFAHGRWFYQQQLNGERRLAELETALRQQADTDKVRNFAVRKANQRHVVNTDEVHWIEADGYYAKLHTARGSFLLRESLNTLDDRLDPRRFVRVHRSTIVNTGFVATFGPNEHGAWTLSLRDGTTRRVSRSGRQRLRACFD